MSIARARVVGALVVFAAGVVGLGSSPASAQSLDATAVLPDPYYQADDCTALLDPNTGCGKACLMRTYFGMGLGPNGERLSDMPRLIPGARFGPRGPGAVDPTNVVNNNLDIEVFPSTSVITGSNTMTILSNADGLTTFTFRLRGNFTVVTTPGATTVTDSIGTYDVVPTLPPADNSTYGRTVTLTRPVNAGQTFSLKVSYTGTALSRGPFGSISFSTQNGTTGAPTAIATLSEPYYAATWWPCKDGEVTQLGDNSDKATIQMAVTVPDTLTVVGNGLLQGIDSVAGSKKKFRWASNYPVATYLVFFSISVYNQYSDTYTYPLPGGGTGTMPVQFSIYTTSDDTPNHNNLAAWRKCIVMLDTYRPIYGLYPFINEKYGIYQFNFGGGQEHQTYTGEGTFDEGVTSHELGHQWWGDNVTCKTWSDIWLNEGFATYTEALWIERRPGSAGFSDLIAAMAARRPSAVNDTVYCFDTTDPNRIFSTAFTYRKGGWVLHMLRKVVGDTTFFNILANHRAAHQLSAATSADFANTASATFGQDLSYFFNEWLYQPGAPSYQSGWQNAVIGGQNYVRFYLHQNQVATYPIYNMPIDVRIDSASGSQTVTLRNDAATDNYLIPVSAPATNVVLDEFNWILDTAKTSVAYVAGPPKIVATTPAPGATFAAAGAPSSVAVLFSDNVTAASGNFAVTRTNAPAAPVPVSFTYSYNAPSTTATLNFGGPLAPGLYTVAVSDAITANAKALDGEIANPSSPASLPSGNGQPNGIGVFTFTVTAPPCLADFNHDTVVNPGDIFAFLAVWFTQNGQTGPGLAADFNGDNVVDIHDIFAFLSVWFVGCP